MPFLIVTVKNVRCGKTQNGLSTEITTTVETLTMSLGLGKFKIFLKIFLTKQPVVLQSRCYTTDPDKKWELCDVPEDPSWPQVPFCGLKDEVCV